MRRTALKFASVLQVVMRYSAFTAMAVISLLVLLTVYDAALNLTLGKAVKGVPELIKLSMIVLCYLSLGYIEYRRRMISIDMFNPRLPRFVQLILDKISLLLCLFFAGLIIWQSYVQGLYIRQTGELSLDLRFPIFPAYFIITFGTILYGIQLILQIFLGEDVLAKKIKLEE